MAFNFLGKNPNNIGLDVGSAVVKAARIKCKSGRFVIQSVAHALIEGFDQDREQHGDQTVKAISRCLADLGEAYNVVCGLSGPEVALRTFSFSAIREAEIPGAARLEALQVCSLNLEQSTLDYQLLSPIRTKGILCRKTRKTISDVKGLMAVAAKHAIERKLQLVEAAGAKCVLMDIDGLALLNCLQACHKKTLNRTPVVLDIGYTYTSIAILLDGGLPFVREIPYAASNIVEIVCKDTGQAKEVVLRALAKPEQDSSSDLLTGAFKSACSKLAQEVSDTIRYCSTQLSGRSGQDFYICGGLAQAKSLTGFLDTLLPGEVRVFDPLSLLPCSLMVKKDRISGSGPGFAVAVGLAMRSV